MLFIESLVHFTWNLWTEILLFLRQASKLTETFSTNNGPLSFYGLGPLLMYKLNPNQTKKITNNVDIFYIKLISYEVCKVEVNFTMDESERLFRR